MHSSTRPGGKQGDFLVGTAGSGEGELVLGVLISISNGGGLFLGGGG